MVAAQKQFLLNTGIYGIAEAARLTKVSRGRIRRWISGYDFKSGDARRHSDAVWRGSLSPLDGKLALGFLDLMEVRFVDAFLRAGVSWKTMRNAHELARKETASDHPFCTNRFATDGRHILARAGEVGGGVLLDLISNQVEFERLVAPFLVQLEFANDSLARWWPMGRDRNIVVDPARNLGQPTVARSGVPARVLAECAKANNESLETVVRWYEVSPDEVKDALDFEDFLAA